MTAIPSGGASVSSSSPARTRETRFFLVDDHPILIKGLSKLLSQEPGWAVCGTSSDVAQAVEGIARLHPDVVILDLSLNGHSGLELVRQLRDQRPRPLTLVFSMHDESLYAARSLRAGASGYVMKHQPLETVLSAIRTVLDGKTYVSDGLSASFTEGASAGQVVDRLQRLTNRELHVFRLLGEGKSTQEIARLLLLSAKTVGSHRSNIMLKLGLKSASQLIQQAIALSAEAAIPGVRAAEVTWAPTAVPAAPNSAPAAVTAGVHSAW